ncbi:hypothetical protein ACTQ4E_11490 [Lawsonibacter sp. LCP25S3_G6]|uniref:hypothetical protein n=1 Tax=unclassified Lawsonibacter TaxID=2617946 RepID=UPI003F95039D
MAAPEIVFSSTGERLSAVEGFDRITVTVRSNQPCRAFECRATKAGEEYGVGKGVLLASFSNTPADTSRTFEIYDDFLLRGDGAYRISLFAQGEDGSWNDNHPYIPVEEGAYVTAEQAVYLCMRE